MMKDCLLAVRLRHSACFERLQYYNVTENESDLQGGWAAEEGEALKG